MPYDPDKLKQAQSQAKPTTSKQAVSAYSAEKLKAAQDGGLNMDREAAIRQGLKQAAIPTVTGLAGEGLGMMTGPLAPVAVPFLGGAFSAGGELINQAMGITEPDMKQVALQAAVPLGLGSVRNVARPLMAVAPPATKGAEFLNRQAAPEMQRRLSALAGPDPAPLFNAVKQSGALFDTGRTRQEIAEALADLKTGSSGEALYGQTIKVLERLDQKLQQSGGRLDPASFQAELRDLGAAKKTAEGRAINQTERGKVDRVFGAMAEALEGAGTPMSRDLLEARRLVKRQSVLDEIEESVTDADKILKGQGGNTQFNAAAVLRDLKKNPFWTGEKGGRNPAFTAAEKKDIESLLEMMNDIPGLKPGAGQNAGSYQVNKSIRSGLALGSATGAGTQDPLLTGAATLAGLAVPTIGEFGRVLNIALRTESGRAELRSLLRQPGTTMATIVSAFGHVAPAQKAHEGPGMPISMTPKPFDLER